ncbi:hypothetical protein PGB90_009538 [Kerria lacca]
MSVIGSSSSTCGPLKNFCCSISNTAGSLFLISFLIVSFEGTSLFGNVWLSPV